MAAQVVEWRREIHRHAELAFEEHRTSALICQVLDQHGIPYKKVAGTGVLARVDGRTADPIHPVVLRADMDALPITEASGLPFACTDGAMHACGHDLHTSALLGALSLAILYAACLIPTGTWGLAALAGLTPYLHAAGLVLH